MCKSTLFTEKYILLQLCITLDIKSSIKYLEFSSLNVIFAFYCRKMPGKNIHRKCSSNSKKRIQCLLWLFILCFSSVFAQTPIASENIFTSLDSALKAPEKVYVLNLSKQKLTTVPSEIIQFTNLQQLNLGKNKLTELPDFIGKLKSLQSLNIEKNRIQRLPASIGQCRNLTELIANRNPLEELPAEMSELNKLEVLDVWGTDVTALPPRFKQLAGTLKFLDLRNVYMTKEAQQAILNLLPDTMVKLSATCNCDGRIKQKD